MTEEVTAYDLPVVGRVPRDLDGRYLRNGPNPLGLEDPRAHHWMQGDGMVHGVRLRNGRAEWYRNRWIRSRSVARKLGEPYPWPEPPADFPANTHVISFRGRALALQEGGPRPYVLDEELRTVGTCDFRGTLDGAFTAHTKYDALAQELHAVAYDPTWSFVRHLVVDRTGRVARTTEVPLPGGPMVHDFALTARHVVIFDVPLTFDADAAARGATVPYVWNKRRQTRIGVLPRAGGQARWFDIDPLYYSHTLNAYDEGDTVVVDVTSMPAPFHAAGRLGGPAAAGPPTLNRWTIDLRRGRVRVRPLDDRPQEFPRLREDLVSRPYRYAYTAYAADMWRAYGGLAGVPSDHAFTNTLIKHDVVRGTSEVHRFPRGAAVSEPVFVPRASSSGGSAAPEPAGGRGEDDGYVLAYAHDPDRGATDLIVLAAQDFSGEPLARVQLPVRVPLGFHGGWMPNAA
ncbi:carotenoid oxygenase family protein [Streptomyces sp. NPDC057676]|uniref:carotenoid oxygenase family protein n=1 Tax=Streptomyces sp. NPDC057676 TaxID=3346205 RepID=UPI0036853BD4